jgi:dihydrolipoamide dehydrogenase
MATEIRVPALGESVTAATVARWIKRPGDTVAADEPLVELETDKVTVEVNAPQAGTLGAIQAEAGAEVEVGAILGVIEAAGTSAATQPPTAKPEPEAAPAPAQAEEEPAPQTAPQIPATDIAGSYDVLIIGSGPGGYVAAIRAAQLGLKTACVEMRATLGGTCLNIGCIPSKALLQSSENFHEVQGSFKDHGINVTGVTLDLDRMQKRKGEVVAANVNGVAFLFKKNKIDWLRGEGRITAPGQVTVDGKAYAAKHIVIATGSESIPLPGVTVDEKRIVTSTGALELDTVPKHLAVIGGGYIGLELGSVWHRLGAEVTVIEYLDKLVPGMDGEIGKAFERILTKQGLKFRLSTKVTSATTTDSGVDLTVEPAKGGQTEILHADVVLVSIGRRPFTKNLGLAEIGVALDERGFVKIDAHYRTNVDGIYAIGDVITGPMLAHKAEEEGVAVAELIAGQAGHVNYGVIPGVVYTWPEVASIGATEEMLKKDGVAYNIGKFPFTANGRARAMGSTDGFVKILADKTTDRVLGAHIIGPDAGTLIAEIATAMEFGASAEDIGRTCHAHPSLSEAVKEAALAADGRALHI